MKTCRKCKQTLHHDEFHRDASRKDGLRGVCKACDKPRRAAQNEKDTEKRREARRLAPPAPQEPPKERRCTACKHTMPIEMFSRSKSGPRGFDKKCKPCNRTMNKKWRDAHGDELRERARLREKTAAAEVSDAYAKHLLSKRSALGRADFPPQLVELKKMQIKLERAVKEAFENEEC